MCVAFVCIAVFVKLLCVLLLCVYIRTLLLCVGGEMKCDVSYHKTSRNVLTYLRTRVCNLDL
jgi:hypothetical protein